MNSALNGDNYYPPEALEEAQASGSRARCFSTRTLWSATAIFQRNIRAFAYCSVDPHGLLADIVEKPDVATGAISMARGWSA